MIFSFRSSCVTPSFSIALAILWPSLCSKRLFLSLQLFRNFAVHLCHSYSCGFHLFARKGFLNEASSDSATLRFTYATHILVAFISSLEKAFLNEASSDSATLKFTYATRILVAFTIIYHLIMFDIYRRRRVRDILWWNGFLRSAYVGWRICTDGTYPGVSFSRITHVLSHWTIHAYGLQIWLLSVKI